MDGCTTALNSGKAPAHYTLANLRSAANCFRPGRLGKNSIRAKGHDSKPNCRCPLIAPTDSRDELAQSVAALPCSDGSRTSPRQPVCHCAMSSPADSHGCRRNSLAGAVPIALPDSPRTHRETAAHSRWARALLERVMAAFRPSADAVHCAPLEGGSRVPIASRSSSAAADCSSVQPPNDSLLDAARCFRPDEPRFHAGQATEPGPTHFPVHAESCSMASGGRSGRRTASVGREFLRG